MRYSARLRLLNHAPRLIRRHLHTTLFALLCSLAAQISSAASVTAGQDTMDGIANDFVKAGLRFQNHDPLPYVYIGPPAWRTEARTDTTTLDAQLEYLAGLSARITALPDTTDPLEARRRRDLLARIQALVTRGEIIAGTVPASFDEETQLLFGVVAPEYDEAHFRQLTAELDSIIPGDGPLGARISAFRKQFVIPPEKLELVIGRAMQECREKTLAHIDLPPNESVTLNITDDMPWVGFTEFRGNSQSTVHLNSSVPVHIERAIELGCHEGYPGHHVHASLIEQSVVKERGWNEYSYIALVGPSAVIAEGAASYAMEVAFSREERVQFERDVLLPLANIDGTELDTYYHFVDLIGELNYARNEAARQYLYRGLPRDDAMRWLMEFGLETEGTAATRLNVIDAQRSYVITYNYGREIVASYIESKPGQSADAVWQSFIEIFTSPLSPIDLLAGDSSPQ